MKTDEEYLLCNPFNGDRDVDIECHTVRIVKARAEHRCSAADLTKNPHSIAPGERAWKETAKVDGRFGSCYCCLPCLDRMFYPDGTYREAE